MNIFESFKDTIDFEYYFDNAKELLSKDARDIRGVDDYGDKIIIRYTYNKPGGAGEAVQVFYKTPQQKKKIIKMIKDSGLKIHNELNPHHKDKMIKF